MDVTMRDDLPSATPVNSTFYLDEVCPLVFDRKFGTSGMRILLHRQLPIVRRNYVLIADQNYRPTLHFWMLYKL